jgi:WD40 repeat protein
MRGTWDVVLGRSNSIMSLAFSPDGTLLASAGKGYSGQLWDVATGRRLLEIETGDYTTSLTFSADGTRLVSSSYDGFKEPGKRARTQVFRLEPGRGIRQLYGLPGAVSKAVFSRDGQRVAALSWDWWVGVWARDSGRLLRLCPVPRGQFPDNADLAFSPDGRRLAVSAGNTATLWDLESGEARRWSLPWGLTEALAFPDPDHLLLFRSETRDGTRPPDSGAHPSEHPRVCVLRNLLGPKPTEPLKAIDDFNWYVQDIEASPEGAYFGIGGTTGFESPHRRPLLRIYNASGAFLLEGFPQMPRDQPQPIPRFDSSGKLVALGPGPEGHEVLLELPSGRFLGPISDRVRGVGPGAQLLDQIDTHFNLQLCDRAGNRLIDVLDESVHFAHVPFSPDHEGRYLMWGKSSGSLNVADLVDVQSRLAKVGLGW